MAWGLTIGCAVIFGAVIAMLPKPVSMWHDNISRNVQMRRRCGKVFQALRLAYSYKLRRTPHSSLKRTEVPAHPNVPYAAHPLTEY